MALSFLPRFAKAGTPTDASAATSKDAATTGIQEGTFGPRKAEENRVAAQPATQAAGLERHDEGG